jgi:hypothetical protein
MTHNARNVEFGTTITDESSEENSNQGNIIANQITNQSARSVELRLMSCFRMLKE